MANNTKVSITCDDCAKELVVDSPYPHNYGLTLECVDFGVNTSDAEFAVYQIPPLIRTYHFCGIECLQHWVDVTRHQEA